MICLSIVLVMKFSSGEFGFWFKSSSEFGGSVARARAAKLSIIRLTHNIWTAVNTDCLIMPDEIKVMQTATTFTVSWNCKNLRMERYTFLHQTTDLTIDLKLSSNNTISEAFFETWVPVIPIANPISALIKAGASLAPSPVTATTWLSLLIPSTKMYLCYGLLLESTHKLLTIFSKTCLSWSF